MPPQTQKTTYKFWFIVLFFFTVIFFTVDHFNPGVFSDIKDFFINKNSQQILKTFGKEISNSGKLILRDVAPVRSSLTNVGTFSFTNKERTKANLPLFKASVKLDAVAERRVKDMFAKQYFEHVSPSGDSASLEADVVGYSYISIGENIALGNFADDATLVLAWMNSPGHRANILNTKFQELGIAVGKGMYEGRETWIAVQVFGKPLSACPATDSNLKNLINSDNAIIDSNQVALSDLKAELDIMSKDSKTDRALYNRKVDEYNTLVSVTNGIIQKVKANVALYNVSVRAFNSCIGE